MKVSRLSIGVFAAYFGIAGLAGLPRANAGTLNMIPSSRSTIQANIDHAVQDALDKGLMPEQISLQNINVIPGCKGPGCLVERDYQFRELDNTFCQPPIHPGQGFGIQHCVEMKPGFKYEKDITSTRKASLHRKTLITSLNIMQFRGPYTKDALLSIDRRGNWTEEVVNLGSLNATLYKRNGVKDSTFQVGAGDCIAADWKLEIEGNSLGIRYIRCFLPEDKKYESWYMPGRESVPRLDDSNKERYLLIFNKSSAIIEGINKNYPKLFDYDNPENQMRAMEKFLQHIRGRVNHYFKETPEAQGLLERFIEDAHSTPRDAYNKQH
ncbi:hypothetical protein JW711_02485 [Candidatus Woesearchaeota archaeon]|nr:hypothetical protein [Candidatus Woesearchaeota archaeon]